MFFLLDTTRTGVHDTPMTDASTASKKPAAKLTPEQSRRVREMIADEGATRAEAVAWVLAFGVTR